MVSGLSGSGKSIALKVLEDAGYYCVDNLPATLLLEVVDFLADAGHERVAVSVDARSASLPALAALSLMWLAIVGRKLLADWALRADTVGVTLQFAFLCGAGLVLSTGNAGENG